MTIPAAVQAWQRLPPQVRSYFNQADSKMPTCIGNSGQALVYHVTTCAGGPATLALKVYRKFRTAVKRYGREVLAYRTLEANGVQGVATYNCQANNQLVEKGHYFLATEFINGQLLNDYMNGFANGQPLVLAIDLMEQLVEIVDELHSKAGIVHRDIKPNNIIRTDDGKLYVFDFGLCYVENQASTDMDDDMQTPSQTDDTPLSDRVGNHYVHIPELQSIAGSESFTLHQKALLIRKRRHKRIDVMQCVAIFFYLLTKEKVGQLDRLVHRHLPVAQWRLRAACSAGRVFSPLVHNQLLAMFDKGLHHEADSRFQSVGAFQCALKVLRQALLQQTVSPADVINMLLTNPATTSMPSNKQRVTNPITKVGNSISKMKTAFAEQCNFEWKKTKKWWYQDHTREVYIHHAVLETTPEQHFYLQAGKVGDCIQLSLSQVAPTISTSGISFSVPPICIKTWTLADLAKRSAELTVDDFNRALQLYVTTSTPYCNTDDEDDEDEESMDVE